MTQDTGASCLGDSSLGNLEGRIEELSALVHQLHADLTTGLDQVNGRIDRLMLAIGGGIAVALVGVVVTLIVQGG